MNRDFLTTFVTPSLESDSLHIDGTFEQDAIVAEHSALGIESTHYEITSVNRSISDLEEIAYSLEELAENAEVSISEGGLDRQAAVMMAAGVHAQTKRLGIENILPSMESFGGTSGRVSATTVSMEGIKEFLANIWKSIVNAFEYLKKRLREFWLKYFDSIPRIKKAAEAMKEKLDKLKSEPEEKKFTVTNLKSVHINGRFPDKFEGRVEFIKKLSDNLKDTKAIRNLAEKYAEALSDLEYDDEETFLDSAKNMKVEIEAAETEESADSAVEFKPAPEDVAKRFGSDVMVKITEEMLGGKMVYMQRGNVEVSTEDYDITIKGNRHKGNRRNKNKQSKKERIAAGGGGGGNSGDDSGGSGDSGDSGGTNGGGNASPEDRAEFKAELKNLSKMKQGITDYSDKDKDIDSSTEVDTLPISTMNDILDNVITTCNTVMDYKKNQPDDDKAADKAKDASERFLKNVEKSENGNSLQTYASQVAGLSTNMANIATSFSAEVARYVGTTLGAIMSVVAKSASQYKKA